MRVEWWSVFEAVDHGQLLFVLGWCQAQSQTYHTHTSQSTKYKDTYIHFITWLSHRERERESTDGRTDLVLRRVAGVVLDDGR